MKLIDGQKIADDLLGEIFERGQASGLWEQQLEIGALSYKDIEFADGYDTALENLYRQIREAEEVKAIPIEWIKNWGDKFYKVINGRRYYMGDGYDTVWDMLEDWEKENESRDTESTK